jgi:C4-dicarboxylate-binding protein DctP
MRMPRRTLLAGTWALLAAPPIARAQAPVMRLSHQYPPGHHIAKVLATFAEEVNARNAGVTVQVFPAQQLARVAENFPGVARGAFEAAVATNFTWGTTIPEMSAPTIPYLFTDLPRIQRFPGSAAAHYLDELTARRGVKSIGWLFTTRISIFTSQRRPIIQLADFQGLKIRGINPMIDSGLAAVGAAPAATPAPEVVGALQSGVLDAGLTDVSAAVSRRYYEVQRYGTIAPFFTVYTQVYVNPRFWDGLAAEARGAVEAGLRKAETDAIALTEQTASAAVDELRAKGMTLHIQTPEEAAVWKAAMQPPVIEAFLRSAGDGGRRALDLLGQIAA